MTPDDSPTITPEGRRAAERFRMIFFLIAAANIVIVALIIWYRQTAADPSDAGIPAAGSTLNEPSVPQSHPPR